MQISLRCQKSEIDFINARQFLQNIHYETSSQAEKLAWRILDPFSQSVAEIGTLSLTDKMDYDNQIRFFLKERVERMLANITIALKARISSLSLFHSEELDEGSKIFFNLLAKEIKVEHVKTPFIFKQDFNLNKQEKTVQSLLCDSKADRELIIYHARRYLNIGNGWTAEKLLKKIQSNKDTQAAQLLSFAYNMQGKSREAEVLYKKWKTSPMAEDQVRACYVLSMLYARHHAREDLSVATSKAYLEEAYKILETRNETNYVDYTFDKVFNRNGYALILFREGKLEEAARLLEWGIATIKDRDTPKERMHLSVLYYNVAQVYERLQLFDQCLAAMNTLIEIDPLFAEYHAEKARILLENFQDTKGAEFEIVRALELDAALFDAETFYEYMYLFNEAEAYAATIRLLRLAESQGLNLDRDLNILLAEALLNENTPDALSLVEKYEAEFLSIAV